MNIIKLIFHEITKPFNNSENNIDVKIKKNDKRIDNIKHGHIYLTDLLSKEQLISLNRKYEKVKDFHYLSQEEKIKINYNQFPYLSPNEIEEIKGKFDTFGFGVRYLNLKPVEENVYINEVFFLKFLDNKKIDVYLSTYWIFNYCIFDKNYIICKLMNKRYLGLDLSLERYLKSKTINELKIILKENNVAFRSNLNKKELIALIISSDINIDITPTYFLTDKGKALIQRCEVYFENKILGYPIYEKDLYDNQDLYYWLPLYINKYKRNFEWGFLRNLYLSFSRLKDKNEKLFLFNCFIIDISGLSNNSYERPENILIVNMYKNIFENAEELLEESIYNELPFNYLTKKEIIVIINKINNYS